MSFDVYEGTGLPSDADTKKINRNTWWQRIVMFESLIRADYLPMEFDLVKADAL